MGIKLTVKDVAVRLVVSEGTVYKLCSQKKLRHIRVGAGRGTIRIDEGDLEEFLRAATVQPEEPAAPKPPPVKLKHLRT